VIENGAGIEYVEIGVSHLVRSLDFYRGLLGGQMPVTSPTVHSRSPACT
jgi:hypothetical protein